MTQYEKISERFAKSPESVHFHEIERILIRLGYEKIPAKGSHIKFKKEWTESDFVIPIHHSDCLPFYKKLILKRISHDLPLYKNPR